VQYPVACLCLQPSDVSRWFTLVGIVASFISTFFAHGFLTLAKQVRITAMSVLRKRLLLLAFRIRCTQHCRIG
jgi:hypothetical protein